MKIPKIIRVSDFVLFSATIACFGSVLFGFNSAVISGAQLFLKDEFSLSSWKIGFLVSNLVLGAAIGAAIGGEFADKYGRKTTLLITSMIFIVGTFVIVLSEIFYQILIGRFIQGIGVGIVSVIVPLYLSEISPLQYRRTIVSLNQLAIVLGLLISYIVDYFYSSEGLWRMMFASGFVPAVALFLGLFFVPESPRWLIFQGKKGLARKVLKEFKLKNKEKEFFIDFPKSTKDLKKEISYLKLLDSKNKYAFIVGIGISLIQQITGINIVIYYAPKIFQLSCFFDNTYAILATIGLGIVMLVMTVISLFFVDKLGRKKLLLIGVRGMVISMFILGTCFIIPFSKSLSVFMVMTYVAFYAISLGPITWLLLSEIFPQEIRGKAMSIAALMGWLGNFMVTLIFLPLLGAIGATTTFYMFALIGLGSYFFIKKYIPETKNKSFEEIQNFWKEKTAIYS